MSEEDKKIDEIIEEEIIQDDPESIVEEVVGQKISEDTLELIEAEETLIQEATRPTPKAPNASSNRNRSNNNNKSGDKKPKRRSRAEAEQQGSEYLEKVVQVRRVTKVVKGGKKLSFRTTVIIGNEKGKVGVGVGKAAEVMVAIKKAISDARKNLVDIDTVANTNTISHTVRGKSGASIVLLKPAADGTGIIAGGTARIVLELAGVGDILAKSQGSKSPLNVARATIDGLKQLRSFQEVANLRGISVKKLLFA